MREALFTKPSSKVTWLCAAFLLGYVGLEVGLGGWIVVFMTKVRGGSAFASGMTATGFWMGLTVGRVILGFVTPRLGEKLAISVSLYNHNLNIRCVSIIHSFVQFFPGVPIFPFLPVFVYLHYSIPTFVKFLGFNFYLLTLVEFKKLGFQPSTKKEKRALLTNIIIDLPPHGHGI